ncbi:MAG TPA: hypothetical protein VF774_06130 [Pseudoduganella sp.]|jgi:hypothetical protein
MSDTLGSPGWRHLPAVLLATVLALPAPPAACQYSEPALGRLFTAPDERMRLDRDRARAPAAGPQAQVADVAPHAMTAPASTPPPPAPMRLTGVVRRSSDGHATIWIDDEPRETTLGRYRAGSAIPVDTPAGRVLVKPGQSVDPDDGAIRDPR